MLRADGGRPAQAGIRVGAVATVLLIAVIGGFVVSSIAGQLPVSATNVVGSVLHQLGIDTAWAPRDELIDQALVQIRFPRAVMSLLVGATLAVAGAVMQAIFGNPLAEPGVVGVSSGAALGAAAVIVSGVAVLGGWTVAVAAFAGGLLSTIVVYLTSRSGGRTEVVTLLLTGIAVNAFCGAGMAVAMFAGSQASREQIVFWQLGSLNGSSFSEVLIVLIVGVIGCTAAILLGRQYDLLSLGERTAGHLGVHVERLRIASIVLVALLTGVAVAFAGIIAFVGLVVPHVIRMLTGPSHRSLLWLSALGGAALLVWADLIARTLIDGADLPIGLLTSLVGCPFFFYLIHRTRREAGGWA